MNENGMYTRGGPQASRGQCHIDAAGLHRNSRKIPIAIDYHYDKWSRYGGRWNMLVCICNAIREKDFREAVRDGAESPCSAYARFGHRPKCGQCISFAKTIIEKERVAA